MPTIGRIDDMSHDSHGFWALVVREDPSIIRAIILNGAGQADPEGAVLLPTQIASERFYCSDSRIDQANSCFKSFPVRVYGKKVNGNPAGEYEIDSATAHARNANPKNVLKPSASAGSGLGGYSSPNKGHNAGTVSQSSVGSFGSGTAVMDPPTVVVPVKIVPPVVKVSVPKRVNPVATRLNMVAADGSPIIGVDEMEMYFDNADVNQAFMIWGPAGCGKSSGVHQYAQNRGKKVYDWRLATMDPTLIQGIGVPDMVSRRTEFFPLAMIPNGPNCILLLDEITQAAPTVQGIAYKITLDRMIGDVPLPSDCQVICAGNRTSDRGVAYAMPSPLSNRLSHLTVMPELRSWQNWAMKVGIDGRIMAFVRLQPGFLHKMETKNAGSAWPSPRSWAHADRFLKSNLSAEAQGVAIASCVGTDAAKDFIKFCVEFEKYTKKVEDILNGKAKDYYESDPAKATTIAVAVVANCVEDPQIFENALAWSKKQNEEYGAIVQRGLAGRFGEDCLLTVPAYTDTVQENGDDLPF